MKIMMRNIITQTKIMTTTLKIQVMMMKCGLIQKVRTETLITFLCCFLGHWISGDVPSGFQSQSRFCLIRFFAEANVMYVL